MDPFTHALAGAAIADSFSADKRLGTKATILSMIAATSPDLDYLVAVAAAFPPKSLAYRDIVDFNTLFRYHRGYTHAFPVMAVAAIPLGLLAWRLAGKNGRIWHWIGLLALCLFSHSLLDITNGWPVKIWLPFSGAGFCLRLAPLFDVFVFAILLASFIANRRPVEVGKFGIPPSLLAGRRMAVICLGLAVLWLAGLYMYQTT